MNNNRKDNKKTPADISSFMYGKVPPQAKELEAAVLGALMLEPHALNEIFSVLQPRHFYSEANQIIYQAILDLSRKHRPVDTLTVVEQLKQSEKLDLVGGPYYIQKLTDGVVSSAHIVQHTFYVIEKYVSRELIRIAGETIQDAYEDSTDPLTLLEKVNSNFYEVNYELDNMSNTPLDVMVIKYIQDREISRTEENMLYTGFPDWDKINGPLFNGGIYTIAARPGMGKTAFVVELIKRVSKKHWVGFINLEMSNNQIVNRFVSNTQEIDNDTLKLPKEKAPAWLGPKVQEGMNEFINMKVQIESKSGLNIEQIISKLKYWKHKYGIRLAVIDFLQIMGTSEERSRYHTDLENMNHNLDRLSQAAKDLDIPIILLSQLNRELLKRGGNKEPDLSDLKGSGKIEEISFQIGFLHRPEYYDLVADELGESTKGLCYYIIRKHRDGILERVKMKFEGQYSRFKDWDEVKFDAPLGFVLGDKWKSIEDGNDDTPF